MQGSLLILAIAFAACSSSGGSGVIGSTTNEGWGLCDVSLQKWTEGVTPCRSDLDCATSATDAICQGFCVTGTPPGPLGYCFTGLSLGIHAGAVGCTTAGDCDDPLSCCTSGNLIDPADATRFGSSRVAMCAQPGTYSVGGSCGIDIACACAQ